MDLKGLNERLMSMDQERERAREQTATGLSEQNRRSLIERELKFICTIAVQQSGKGPRRVTAPILLRKDADTSLSARIFTFDSNGDPCNYDDAKKYEISVEKHDKRDISIVPVATENVWGNYSVESVGQTVAMLAEAIYNPELNPGLQDRISMFA